MSAKSALKPTPSPAIVEKGSVLQKRKVGAAWGEGDSGTTGTRGGLTTHLGPFPGVGDEGCNVTRAMASPCWTGHLSAEQAARGSCRTSLVSGFFNHQYRYYTYTHLFFISISILKYI